MIPLNTASIHKNMQTNLLYKVQSPTVIWKRKHNSIIEYLKLEGTRKAHRVLAPRRTTPNQTISASTVQMLLELQQPGAMTTALGSLCQCPTTLFSKGPFTHVQFQAKLLNNSSQDFQYYNSRLKNAIYLPLNDIKKAIRRALYI